MAAEQALGVRAVTPLVERTGTYEVSDARLIPKIIRHPLVEDTHHIDPATAAFSPELPPARAAARRWYASGPLAGIAAGWPLLSAGLLAIGLVLAWPSIRALPPARVTLGLILVLSLVLRTALVMSGGQFYWPDERRYYESGDMVEAVAAGDAHAAWTSAATSHPLFKALGMLPAAFERTHGRDSRIPGLFFSLFGVLNVWLLVRVARRLGAGEVESLIVAVLFAASTSFLYFARHLLPYNVAMTFGLLSLHAAAAADDGWRFPLACGFWAACTFLAYYGYWTFGGAACAVCVLGGSSWKDVMRRAAATGAGLVGPLFVLAAVSAAMGDGAVALLRGFSALITQGSVAEGWRLPFAYLWHAEHLLLLLWLAATGWCVATWPSWRNVPAVRAGLIGLLFVYLALAIPSTGLGVFVVYGRLARQLVPFFCLVTAFVLAHVCRQRLSFARVSLPVIVAAIVLQAAWNARQVFAQQFPQEFIISGEQMAARLGASRATILYAKHIYPPVTLDAPPDSLEVMSASHPLQFWPYQYEGFTPEQRRVLRSTDMRMRVLIPAGQKHPAEAGHSD